MASSSKVQPSHFFTIILNSTLEAKKLRIPKKFVRIFGDELPSVARLKIPDGRVWQVGLEKIGREIWLDNGWSKFMQFYSISLRWLLVFEYNNKKSSFNVVIFNPSACEIEYPNNVEETENEMDITKNPSLNSLNNKISEHGPGSYSKVQPQKSQQNPTRPSFAADIEDEDKLQVLLEDMGICVKKGFGNITAEEKERAMAAARWFKPKNPSFMVILQLSDVKRQRIYVPTEFACRYFSGTRCLKVWDSEGGEWSGKISGSPVCCLTRLGGIWKMMNEGDICVFELISREELKISIYKLRN